MMTLQGFYSHKLLLKCILIFSTLVLVTCTAQRKLYRAKADKVPDNYFVHFQSTTTPAAVKVLVEELRRLDQDTSWFGFHSNVQGIVTKVGYGIAVTMSEEALEYVLKQPIVSFVEEDSYITPNQLGDPVPTNNTRTVGSWGIDRMDTKTNEFNGRYTPPCGLTGRGVDVYVVDSGLYYDHLQFGQRATFSGCDAIEQLANTTNTNNGRDCDGHGTWVGGIIGSSTMGVAPGANLLSVRVLDCDRTGSWNGILLGLECILNRVQQQEKRPAVVNLSFTGAGKNLAVKRAIDKLIDSGVTVVGISGNSLTDRSGNSCKVSPGSVPGVITVAGTTKSDKVYNRTLLGRCVDVLAPAKDISSVGNSCRRCRVTRLHGSSFAAPHVTGAIALLLEKCPNLPPWKVRYYLQTKLALPDVIQTRGLVPSKYQITTPNLLVHTGPEMCTIEC